MLKLCRLSSREDEYQLSNLMAKYENLLPEQIGIGEYFTCNGSSKLNSIFNEVQNQIIKHNKKK